MANTEPSRIGQDIKAKTDVIPNLLDRVYFDSVNGEAGTAWPIGTAGRPVDNLADAKTIMTANKTPKLQLVGDTGSITFNTNTTIELVGNPGYDITVSAGITCNFIGDFECYNLTNTTGSIDIWGNLHALGTVTTATGWIHIFGNAHVGGAFTDNAIGSIDIYGDCLCASDLNNYGGNINIFGKYNGAGVINQTTGYIGIFGGVQLASNILQDGAGAIEIYGDCECGGNITTTGTGQIYIYGRCSVNNIVNTGTIAVQGVASIRGTITNSGTLTYKGAQVVVASSTTANWNTAAATSLLAGEDVVSFGTTATVQKLRYLKIGIGACTAGAVIHVRLYNVDTTTKFYDEQYVRQADALASQPDELEIANNHYIMGVVRVEVYSDTSESVAITYKYQLEAT